MEYQLKFRFVSYYYDDKYQFTSRIINFVKDYYEIIFDEGHKLTKDKMILLDKNEIIFGEIIPYFLNQNIIKNFSLDKNNDMEELLDEIEAYILSFRKDGFNQDRKSIVISLNHSLD
jgi:hypothetical protein